MNDHFLLEAIWVLFTYGWPYLVGGLAIASVMVIWGSRCMRHRSGLSILAVATVVLWIALFAGVDSGYRAWQNSPNPPDEAFSDTGGPLTALFAGWLPSLVVLGLVYLLLRLCWRSLASRPTAPPGSQSGPD